MQADGEEHPTGNSNQGCEGSLCEVWRRGEHNPVFRQVVPGARHHHVHHARLVSLSLVCICGRELVSLSLVCTYDCVLVSLSLVCICGRELVSLSLVCTYNRVLVSLSPVCICDRVLVSHVYPMWCETHVMWGQLYDARGSAAGCPRCLARHQARRQL